MVPSERRLLDNDPGRETEWDKYTFNLFFWPPYSRNQFGLCPSHYQSSVNLIVISRAALEISEDVVGIFIADLDVHAHTVSDVFSEYTSTY